MATEMVARRLRGGARGGAVRYLAIAAVALMVTGCGTAKTTSSPSASTVAASAAATVNLTAGTPSAQPSASNAAMPSTSVASTDSAAPQASATASSSASASAPALAPGNVEIISLYPDDAPDSRNLAQVNAAFAAQFPGSKATLNFPGGQLAEVITNRWLAGNPPEVNYGFFHGGSSQAWQYAESGQLYDLTNAVAHPLDGYGGKSWLDSVLPGIRPFMTYPKTGQIYGVPREVQAYQFYYNKKIFQAAGIQPPTTWTEFLAVCAKLKAAGIEPLTVSGPTQPYVDIYYSYLLARLADPKAVQAALDGKSRFKDVAGVLDAAKELDKLAKGGYFQKGFAGTDFTAAQITFFQGKQAMILMGNWLFAEMKDSIPKDFQAGIFSFPAVEGGAGDQKAVIGGVIIQEVAAKSARPDLGVEWLRIQASMAQQEARSQDLNYLSAYTGVTAPAGFESVAADLAAGGSLILEDWGGYAAVSITQQQRDAYGLPISELVLGKITPEQLVSEIDANLARFWKLA